MPNLSVRDTATGSLDNASAAEQPKILTPRPRPDEISAWSVSGPSA